MNTTFHDVMVGRIGLVTRMPYKISCLVFLPLIYMSSADVLYCDGEPCPESAKGQGFNSVTQYMMMNASGWALGIVFVIPTTYPVMLIGLSALLSNFSKSN